MWIVQRRGLNHIRTQHLIVHISSRSKLIASLLLVFMLNSSLECMDRTEGFRKRKQRLRHFELSYIFHNSYICGNRTWAISLLAVSGYHRINAVSRCWGNSWRCADNVAWEFTPVFAKVGNISIVEL